jgi:hypothetical protein
MTGGMKEEHTTILQNIQDCHNSIRAGRPKDKLESDTKKFESCFGCSNENETSD